MYPPRCMTRIYTYNSRVFCVLYVSFCFPLSLEGADDYFRALTRPDRLLPPVKKQDSCSLCKKFAPFSLCKHAVFPLQIVLFLYFRHFYHQYGVSACMYFFFEVYYAFSIPKPAFLQRENSRHAAHETKAKPNAAQTAGGRPLCAGRGGAKM